MLKFIKNIIERYYSNTIKFNRWKLRELFEKLYDNDVLLKNLNFEIDRNQHDVKFLCINNITYTYRPNGYNTPRIIVIVVKVPREILDITPKGCILNDGVKVYSDKFNGRYIRKGPYFKEINKDLDMLYNLLNDQRSFENWSRKTFKK